MENGIHGRYFGGRDEIFTEDELRPTDAELGQWYYKGIDKGGCLYPDPNSTVTFDSPGPSSHLTLIRKYLSSGPVSELDRWTLQLLHIHRLLRTQEILVALDRSQHVPATADPTLQVLVSSDMVLIVSSPILVVVSSDTVHTVSVIVPTVSTVSW
ncbi:hypothetical protein Q3G72_028274 [Acer saccharum]|nr:hypothetical protein Q3G72_028274 [Acer saccharum]